MEPSGLHSTAAFIASDPPSTRNPTQPSPMEQEGCVPSQIDTNTMKIKMDEIEALQIRERLINETIRSFLGDNPPHVIEAEKVQEIIGSGLTINELLQGLVAPAKNYALPPISNFRVGEAALGKSGNIYLGVNVEAFLPLDQAIHGEQFILALMRLHGDEPVKIALPAAPCGHCRQFMYEIGENAPSLIILTPRKPPRTLIELFPEPFGPQDLGLEGGLFTPHPHPYTPKHSDPVFDKAIEAAFFSYAPYTKALSGAAIQTFDGKIYYGSNLENAAYNPTLPPFRCALVSLIASGHTYKDIKKVVLAELEKAIISHEVHAREHLKQIAPEADFYVVKMDSF